VDVAAMILPGEGRKTNQRALANLLSLGLSGGMPAMKLAAVIAERHPSVTPEAMGALIARQQQKRRDELATLAALEVICRGGGKTLTDAIKAQQPG
jgi:hypothetical protein